MKDGLDRTSTENTNEDQPTPDPTMELQTNHEMMLKEIRSWGFWSLGLGVLHLIAAGFLDSAWGLLLIIVGLASFYFRTASMFIVYTVVLAWAALSNLISLNPEWMIFALLQLYLAFRTFKDFRRFQNTEKELIAVSTGVGDALIVGISRRSARSFPWIGTSLGCLSIIFCAVTIAVTIFLIDETLIANQIYPPYYLALLGSIEILGVLGFAVSLTSVISKYEPKFPPRAVLYKRFVYDVDNRWQGSGIITFLSV
jgi:hypothetical protein